jgi:hypothetical protein
MGYRPFRSNRRPDRRLFAALAAALSLVPAALGAQAPLATVLAGQETSFVAGVADLPLMPGLAEVPEAGVVFEKPSGRIVEAYAEGAVNRTAVTTFYLSTLPNLGWRAKAKALFQREGELLRLGFMGNDGALVVHFTLQPE